MIHQYSLTELDIANGPYSQSMTTMMSILLLVSSVADIGQEHFVDP